MTTKLSNLLRSCVALCALAAISAMFTTDTAAQEPEQERLALIDALQRRLQGTRPDDWIVGGAGFDRGVTAIPLSADNATNTADVLAIGKKTWERRFKNGKTFANCFPNAGRRIASTYPQYEPATRQVVTFEMALNRCLQLHGEPMIPPADAATMGPLSAYARTLAEGARTTIRVSGPDARGRYDGGKRLFHKRMGQQNFACASCHIQHAGEVYGTTTGTGGLAPAVGMAVSWPRLEPGGNIRTLQSQFQRCMKKSGAEPLAEGSDDLNNLEYYLAYLSTGLPLRPLATAR
jgi:L-cysteine S-thiosulfotransferase